jgi:hypothetical protein
LILQSVVEEMVVVGGAADTGGRDALPPPLA